MRALLLAAGLGTRLRPLTDTIPKCLVPIKGKPLLEIWLDGLAKAGVGPFLVNTHHLSIQVEEFVSSSQYRNVLTTVHESVLLGTAGTLMKNLAFFQGEDGMLIHADNYCLADLSAFQQAHRDRPKGCLMTMMTFRTNEPSACGIVELDDRSVVIGFHEKVINPPGNLANGAIYILSKELIKKLHVEFCNTSCFSTQVLPTLLNKIYTYETNSILLDIGTPKRYEFINT